MSDIKFIIINNKENTYKSQLYINDQNMSVFEYDMIRKYYNDAKIIRLNELINKIFLNQLLLFNI